MSEGARCRAPALALLLGACSSTTPAPDAAAPDAPGVDAPGVDAPEPDGACLRERGVHRLFVQGHEAPPRADGTWPLVHDHRLCDDAVFVEDTNGDGVYQPGEEPLPLGPAELVHGEHFLVGVGAFVELSYPLCADLAGDATLYVPNYDEAGSRALHELLVRRGDVEELVVEAIDEEAGNSGYNPFVRVLNGTDPGPSPDATLVLRSTNLNGVPFSVMVWRPPSEYESWIRVEVE